MLGKTFCNMPKIVNNNKKSVIAKIPGSKDTNVTQFYITRIIIPLLVST